MAVYKLGDIIQLNSTYKKSETINYLELSGISNFETNLIKQSLIPSRAKWNIDKGTIIIGRVRPANRNHNKYEGKNKLVGSSGFTCFKSNFKIILNDYLWYILQKDNFYNFSIDYAKGSTYPEISQSDLFEFTLNIPSISEQEKIIEIIKPFEDALQLVEKMIFLMKDIFYLKETKFTINDFVSNINTGFAYKKTHLSDIGDYNIFTIKNISGSSKFDKTNFIRNNLLKFGDVITGMSGTLGTATIITSKNLASNQRTLSFASKYPAQISFSIELQKNILNSLATGAVQKNITKDNILSLSFEPIFSNQFDIFFTMILSIKELLIAVKELLLKLLVK